MITSKQLFRASVYAHALSLKCHHVLHDIDQDYYIVEYRRWNDKRNGKFSGETMSEYVRTYDCYSNINPKP